MKTGVELIAEERARQIAEERFTSDFDDTHTEQELLKGAIAYACHELDDKGYNQAAQDIWPWGLVYFKAGADPLRNLVKAGALIAAEIDRLNRLSRKGGQ